MMEFVIGCPWQLTAHQQTYVPEQIINSLTIEELEALKYAKGTPVELKEQPGQVDRIAEYDPMLVPPIWLENDPMPRYPHELKLLSPLNYRSMAHTSQAA